MASADARRAGRRRALARAARRLSGTSPRFHAVGLDGYLRPARPRDLRRLYRICGSVGTAPGTGRLWGDQFAQHAHFPREFLERMAVDAFIPGIAGAGDDRRFGGARATQTV